MINKLFTLALIGIIAGAMSAGCVDTSQKKVEAAKDKVDNASQDLKTAQANYANEWQTFKGESELKIKKNDNSIDKLQDKMEKSGSQLKAKYNKSVVELKRKNKELKAKMEEYKDEGKDKWEAFKSGFNRDMDKVEKAVKDLTADTD
jgi:hypothetical protein